MAKFRKKPVVVEAVRWTGVNREQVEDFAGWGLAMVLDTHSLYIPTLEGSLLASIGDWIIRGVKGELYPCKDEIFRLTYEPMDGATDMVKVEEKI